MGLTENIISNNKSRDTLEAILEGLPFHDFESSKPGDLLVFEFPYTQKFQTDRGIIELEFNLSYTSLAHAAIFLGPNSVFQQDRLNGSADLRDLSTMVNLYANIKAYPGDLMTKKS